MTVGKKFNRLMVTQQKLNRLQLLVYCLSIPVSLALSEAVKFALSFNMHPFKGQWLINIIISSLVAGALVGVAQWFLLIRKVSKLGGWIVASSLGWLVGTAMILVVGNAVFSAVNLAIFGRVNLVLVWMISAAIAGVFSGALGGTFLGSAQWLFLRSRVPKANQWILASAVGWAASAGLSEAIRGTIIGPLGLTLGWICYGAIYGPVTALSQKLSRR